MFKSSERFEIAAYSVGLYNSINGQSAEFSGFLLSAFVIKGFSHRMLFGDKFLLYHVFNRKHKNENGNGKFQFLIENTKMRLQFICDTRILNGEYELKLHTLNWLKKT